MKSLLFDYGGTLDADGSTWIDRFYPLYKEAGHDFPRNTFDRAFYDADNNLPARHSLKGLDLEQTLRLQVQDVLKALAPEQIASAGAIAARFTANSRLHFAKLRPVLERLRGRYQLGVVSNFYGNLEDILRAEGLRDLFAVVADSGALGVTKPEPGIFLHAANAMNSVPKDCVMVGDSIARDMAGATGVGMKKALIAAGASVPDAGQDWTIRSVLDLEAVLP